MPLSEGSQGSSSEPSCTVLGLASGQPDPPWEGHSPVLAAVTSWGAGCLASLLPGRGVLSSTLGAQRITSSEKACVSIWNIPEGLCGNPEVKFLKDSLSKKPDPL